MKKLLYVIVASIAILCMACGGSSTTSKKGPVKWVKVEFFNPTNDPMVATLFSFDGYSLKDTVPPNSFVLDSIEEGNYTLESKNLKTGDSQFYPSVTEPSAAQIADTAHFTYALDSARKDKRLVLRFYPVNYVGGTKPNVEVLKGHYVFDLTLDSMKHYAVVNMNFVYGVKSTIDNAFRAQTENGKYFIFSTHKASGPMIMPNMAYNPFEELPESIPTTYGVKSYVFKTYSIPQDVAREDILMYLYQNVVLQQ